MQIINDIKVFDKEDEVYALLNSTSFPNKLILAKVRIIDIDADDSNPAYSVQILKFYDSFSYIKENYIKHNQKYARRSSKSDAKIKPRISPNKLKQYTEISTMDEVYGILHGTASTYKGKYENNQPKVEAYDDYPERHFVYVEAIFVFQTKAEAMQVLDEITDFEIFRILRYLKTLVVRKSYNGIFKVRTFRDFFNRIRNFIAHEKTDNYFRKIKRKI